MRTKVLLVSHVASHPGASGNASRIRSLVKHIDRLGHELHFLYLTQNDGSLEELRAYWSDRLHVFRIKPHRSTPSPVLLSCCQRLDRLLARQTFRQGYSWLIKKNLCVYRIDDWYDDRLSPFLEALQADRSFDVVIVAYVFHSKALTCFPAGVRKVIDTHDVFADRHQRFFAAGMTPSWFFTTRRQERIGLQRADVILAIQQQEARYFERLKLKQTRVLTVGHAVEPCEDVELTSVMSGRTLLFIGADNAVNRDALDHLQKDIYPEIRAAIPDSRLIIAGNISKFARQEKDVDIRGVVGDLTQLYREAAVVINPVRFGTGLKIKSVEAMAHGKPLVTTHTGVEGLSLPAADVCVVANSASALISATVALFRDESKLRQLSRNALSYARELNRQVATSVAAIFD